MERRVECVVFDVFVPAFEDTKGKGSMDWKRYSGFDAIALYRMPRR